MNNVLIIAITAGLVYLWMTSDEITVIDPQTGEPQATMPQNSSVQALPLPVGQQPVVNPPQPTISNIHYVAAPVGGGQGGEYRMQPMVGSYAVGGILPDGTVLLENPHITHMNNMPAGSMSMFEPFLF